MKAKLHALAVAAVFVFSAPALADPVRIVAAENFYGDSPRRSAARMSRSPAF